MARSRLIALGLASLSWLAGCEKPPEERDDVPQLVETGDLAQIEARGVLRILLPRLERSPHLPRDGYTLDVEELLAEDYARGIGLEPRWVYVDSRDELLPALLQGKGDLVAANLTVTQERKQKVRFTVPVATVREQIVIRTDDHVNEIADLYGRRIALRQSSSFWKTVEELRKKHPRIEVEEVPGRIDIEEIIHRVATGRYDLTVADSNVVQAVRTYRDDVRAALDLTRDRSIAWAVRPDSVRLRKSLDRFLSQSQLTRRPEVTRTGDLAQIKETKTLRVLTRNNAACYFLHRGEVVGFEYELVRQFARKHGLRLEMIIPPNGEDLLPWLREGRGDIVAAALTPTEERLSSGGVTFSRPYNYVKQILVTRAEDNTLHEPEDLAGRRVHVRRSASYWNTLAELQNDGIRFELVAAPEVEETEEIIAKVADGSYDLTVADSHILSIELTWRNDVKAAFALTDEQPTSWVMRETNPELAGAIDAFLTTAYRGAFYNLIYDRYFGDESRVRANLEGRSDQTGAISPYDEIVRQYAAQYGFDWRLILSQMYQESRFDPRAESFAGARGLMQVMPHTAEQLGFDSESIYTPEISIHAGVRYLDWVRDRFEPELPVRDRMWFALAAYNAGPGHVREARRLARKQGLNPDRWFGNVERAMLLLARQEYAQQSRYGYCRCTEPVNYVRDILTRYNAYVDTLDDTTASDSTIRSAL